jgi:hypothetical protein
MKRWVLLSATSRRIRAAPASRTDPASTTAKRRAAIDDTKSALSIPLVTGAGRPWMATSKTPKRRLERSIVAAGAEKSVSPSRATLAEIAHEWLETQVQLRPRTRDAYASSLRNHILPRFGRLRIGEITDNDIALLIAEMHAKGYKGWTIRSTLNPLSRILGNAARRGLIGSNPMRRLERGERPPGGTSGDAHSQPRRN